MLSSFFIQRILPAVTFTDEKDAIPVAEAILLGGLSLMEIPFRTAKTAASILAIRKRFPEMNLGAGTILNISQLRQAIDSGAQFGLSPGYNPVVVAEAAQLNFPFIPGVMTPSEIEAAGESGCRIQKLFPAGQINGVDFLKSLQEPYEQLELKFIPMGGVNLQNMNDYLKLKNVIAIGGSWLASKQLIGAGDYAAIRKNVSVALESINKI